MFGMARPGQSFRNHPCGIPSDAATTLYSYGAGGDVLSETDSAGTMQKDYIYFGGKRIA